MKLLIGLKLALALAVALAAVVAFGDTNNQVSAQQPQRSNQSVAYAYVAQSGDSYTKMARKAVQTYGLKHKVNLSPAAIIFAETNLTRAAGSPELNLGQEVKINESTVREWVDKARGLSGAAQAAWNYYVQFVDFDTSNVGESR